MRTYSAAAATSRSEAVHAEDAGAVAVLVFNIAGDPIAMIGDPGTVDIPALMIGQADGNRILDEINLGETVRVVIDKELLLTVEDTGNRMGVFSSRGPAPVQDILKPDVTAPGINILAGFTPDAIAAAAGENFAYLTGTSMSVPHVAGVAALLRQAHPEWSPAAIKSALMTTARQNVTLQDGETAALPFDFGAGHIRPNAAVDPGIVYDAGDDDYDAFACALGADAVTAERCNALTAAGVSLDPGDMNQPSVAVARLADTQTVSRRVTNVGDTSATYTAVIESPTGIETTVTPPSLSLAPGQTAGFDVTYTYRSGPLDSWRFGSLTWEDDDHSARSVLAVRPVSLTAPAEVVATGTSGTLTFPVEFGYDGAYTARVHGLRKPLVIEDFVARDVDKNFETADSGNGATAHLYAVPSDQAYLRFAMFDELTDGADDLDMYVYYCPDDVNCARIGESGGDTSREQFDVLLPGSGTYIVFVHGFETDDVAGGPGTVYRIAAWQFGLDDDVGNMTVTAPAAVTSGSTEEIRVDWNGLDPDTIHLGGISHSTPGGLSSLTVISIQN
ncbi:MAG: S8 family serine peptidase [Woeseiaceae bacterium]|nr:S8 family serine peptidase [Woeseiaceae bacterium]